MSFLDKPHAQWWRKALFQIHLWTGIFAGIYAILIGVSGSILVFKDELAALSYPQLMKNAHPSAGEHFDLAEVMRRAQAAYPDLVLAGGYVPEVGSENVLVLMTKGTPGTPHYFYAVADPADGRPIGLLDLNSTWLYWISDLHVRLLAGVPGAIANAAGGGILLLLSLSGIVLWWPGIRRWTSALKIDFRRNWRRINFDAHSAVGLYSLVLVCLWSISGIYFIFPKQVAAAVGWISSPAAAIEPEIKVQSSGDGVRADLSKIISAAKRALPHNSLSGVYLGQPGKDPVRVFLARGHRDDFTQMDYVFFHPATGELLSIWRSGFNPTLGSKFLFWLGPLHFGVAWGLGVKILWALFGLSLPLLAITGALMYWNRSLRRTWKRFRHRTHRETAAPLEEVQPADSVR